MFLNKIDFLFDLMYVIIVHADFIISLSNHVLKVSGVDLYPCLVNLLLLQYFGLYVVLCRGLILSSIPIPSGSPSPMFGSTPVRTTFRDFHLVFGYVLRISDHFVSGNTACFLVFFFFIMINDNRYTRDAVVPRTEVTLLLQRVRNEERRRGSCLTVISVVLLLLFFHYVAPYFSLDEKLCRLVCDETQGLIVHLKETNDFHVKTLKTFFPDYFSFCLVERTLLP